MMQHEWIKSTLGHGDVMCAKCYITNLEAVALGLLHECDPPPPKAANANVEPAQQLSDDDPGMICPLSDKARLDAFVAAGVDADDEIERLREALTYVRGQCRALDKYISDVLDK